MPELLTPKLPSQLNPAGALSGADVWLVQQTETEVVKSTLAALVAYIGASTFDGAFGSLTGLPNTLAGYGITDALTAAQLAATYQPLDSDLTAIAALTTDSFGRSLLTLSNAAAARTALELGTAALSASTDFATAAQGALADTAIQPAALALELADYQPLDSDLTAIAALTTTSYGRALLELADAAAGRTALGLGTAAVLDVGVANGVAPLDSGGKISTAYLPDTVLGQVEYQGTWNASTDTPTLPSAAAANKGHYYIVSTGGTWNTLEFNTGDWVISDGSTWTKVDNTDAISSFNGRTGAIVPASGDYSAFYQPLDSDLTAIAALTTATFGRSLLTESSASTLKTTLSLNNVENTALSTWAGSGNITTLGTVATGTWNATTIGVTKGGTGKTSIAASRLLWSTSSNTLGEIALGYGMTVTSSELRTPQDLQTSANPEFAGLELAGGGYLTWGDTFGFSTAPAISGGLGTGLDFYPAGGAGGSLLQMTNTGNLVVSSGSITTGAPSGGTADTWKLGSYTSGYVQTQIGATARKLATGDQGVATTDSPTFASLTLTTPLAATRGGTGQSSFAVGDVLYASTTSALSKLAGVATGNALISGGVNTAPSWGKIGLTTHVSGTLAVGNGGTGQTSYAVGDLLYASTTSALSKLADVATGSALISGGVGVAPSWGKVGLTTHVSGTLGVANGGTGLTSIASGKLLYASSANTLAELTLGTNLSITGGTLNAAGGSGDLTLTELATGFSIEGGSSNSRTLTVTATSTLDQSVATTATPTFVGANFTGNYYLARAWVNFNGTGTVAIRASGNVSSITDHGTGQYSANFSSAMSDANYAMAGVCVGTESGAVRVISPGADALLSTTSARFYVRNITNDVGDSATICLAFFR